MSRCSTSKRVTAAVLAALVWLLTPAFAQATITCSHLATSSDSANALTYTTASISPSANAVVLVFVGSQDTDAAEVPAVACSASGGCAGLTFAQVATVTYNTIAAPVSRLSLFRALGGSPSAGTVTFTFSDTQIGAEWSILQCTGVNTGGSDGSSAVVQSATSQDDTITTTPGAVTLSAFASAGNATVGGCSGSANITINAGSGFTLGGTSGHASPNQAIGSQYQHANDTSVEMTGSGSARWACVAAEIAETPPVGGGGAKPRQLLLGIGRPR